MRIKPYLSFDGQCEAALQFYERCLGGKIVYLMTYAQSPMATRIPPEWGKQIYHATFSFMDQILRAADAPPGSYRPPQDFSLTLEIDEPAEAERVFEMLSEKGTVQMSVQETPWHADPESSRTNSVRHGLSIVTHPPKLHNASLDAVRLALTRDSTGQE